MDSSRRLFLLAFIFTVLTVPALAAIAQTEGVGTVKAWEGTLTLPTYRWNDSPYPVFAVLGGGIYYPYPEQDDITSEKADRTYKAVFLENDYLKVTCLPELGGRIHSVLDKTTGEEMFHTNNEIKPSLIAMRGAWVSGGIEWNTGPTGHTVTAVSPVDVQAVEHEDGSASIVINNIEQVFRTRWTVQVTLHPGRSYLDEHIRLYNGTDTPQTYYFWNNTAFPCLPGTRFEYPMDLWTDHGSTVFSKWPVVDGRDMSELDNYPVRRSIFAYGCVYDFFGAYDVNRDQGIVSYANHHSVPGKKAWTWGKDDYGVVSQLGLSDADRVNAQYIEVQTGPLLSQSEIGLMAPHQTIAWDEYWYPVHGLGTGFEYATKDAAMESIRHEDTRALELRLLATGVFPGATFIAESAGDVLVKQTLDLDPATPATFTLDDPPAGPLAVRLVSQEGDVLLQYATPLAIPDVAVPDVSDVWAQGGDTAGKKYAQGVQWQKSFRPVDAKGSYEDALQRDPFHVPSLTALAAIELELGNNDAAAKHAQQALKFDSKSGAAWYALGVAQLGLGQPEAALASGHHASRDAAYAAVGQNLAGRAAMRLQRYAVAVTAFKEAQKRDPLDLENRAHALIARYMLATSEGSPVEAVMADVGAAVKNDPADLNLRALAALGSEEGMAALRTHIANVVGEKEFGLLETAVFFTDLGLYNEATRLLDEVALSGQAGFDPSALIYYHLVYFSERAGDATQAEVYAGRASEASSDFVFPSRTEALPVLEWAVGRDPKDANAHLLLGYLLADLYRLDEALPHWEKAVEVDPELKTAWRLLAVHASRSNKLEEAEAHLKKGLEAAPQDQTLLRELAVLTAAQDRRPEAIDALEVAHAAGPVRHEITLLLAEYYNAEQRYDDAIALLESTDFPNREGASRPRELWAQARLARGEARYNSGDFDGAQEDYQAALTYPDNFLVGKHYEEQTAHIWYQVGRAALAAGRPDEARDAWQTGANEVSESVGGVFAFEVSENQKKHIQLCRSALEVLNAQEGGE
jgi:tetratricopeptide (TPR) repeat protein